MHSQRPQCRAISPVRSSHFHIRQRFRRFGRAFKDAHLAPHRQHLDEFFHQRFVFIAKSDPRCRILFHRVSIPLSPALVPAFVKLRGWNLAFPKRCLESGETPSSVREIMYDPVAAAPASIFKPTPGLILSPDACVKSYQPYRGISHESCKNSGLLPIDFSRSSRTACSARTVSTISFCSTIRRRVLLTRFETAT